MQSSVLQEDHQDFSGGVDATLPLQQHGIDLQPAWCNTTLDKLYVVDKRLSYWIF
jgi:hypothetical protein